MEQFTQEQRNNSDKRIANLLPHQYKKGQSGNPGGRPKGISLKEYVRNRFMYMSEDEREEFLEGINKIELFRMAEGNPDTKQDVTVRELPKPILGGITDENKGTDSTVQ
jgi:hypothetical protein